MAHSIYKEYVTIAAAASTKVCASEVGMTTVAVNINDA